MKLKKFTIFLFFILFLITALFFLFSFYQTKYGQRVITKVWLGDYNLEGLTQEELKKFLEKETTEIEREGIKFYTAEKDIVIYPMVIAIADPDLTRRVIDFKIDQTIEDIFLLPQRNIISRFLKKTDKQTIQLALEINEDEILKILKSNFEELEKPAQNASVKYEAGEWVVLEEKAGAGFSYLAAIKELKNNLSNLSKDSISLKTIILSPKIYKENVKAQIDQAEKIANLSPIKLFYGNETWEINKEKLASWIDFQKNGPEININLNEEKIQDDLLELAKKIDRPAQEAKFKLEDDRVAEFQLAREGRKLEIKENSKKIKDYILANIKKIELAVSLEKPQILTGDINDFGINELVGQGESDFKGSPFNRVHNIKIGAKILNGLLIEPRQEFSLIKALGPINEAVGYLPELVIKGNRTIPELGGGLCQIATTIFRVALNTGVEITERRPHAFRVIYYEPAGLDATFYNPSPDFRFINDYSSWLLLQTKVEGTKLIFEFYGTGDNRKIEMTPPRIFNIVAPGPVRYIESEELAPGAKKLLERPVAGANTEFTRTIIFADEEKREEVWESYYRPWSEVWLIGKQPSVAPLNETEENESET